MNRYVLALALSFSSALALMPYASHARDRCDGDFELVRGSWVATRYCRAVEIARVAREAGKPVSPRALLASRELTQEVCRFVGSDYRVHPACETLHGILQFSW